MRNGRRIEFFEPFAKFEWYPMTRCVFVLGTDYPISTEAYNLKQARAIASSHLTVQHEEDSIHEG
jgi:hypothetical protein